MEKEIKRRLSNISNDTTKYGEFVSSYFAWITLDKQKEIAGEMEVMTKTEKFTEEK